RDLVQHARGAIELPGTGFERGLQATTADIAHHQVGALMVTPVVIERDDVGMLQPRDKLGLCLKAADEVGVIGKLRQNDLDGDLTPYPDLLGTVYRPKTTHSDRLKQLIALDDLMAAIGD